MDPEFVALMVAFGLALVPIGLAFRAPWLRAGLVVCWIGVGLAAPSVLTIYRSAHAVAKPVNRPVERLREDYVSSKECGACHPHEYDAWRQSWHRTMTQVASPEAIFGDFDGVDLKTHDWKTRLERRGDKFFARFFDQKLRQHVWREIVLTTGSHHMQAYWYTRGPGKPLGQLQFTYLKEDQKWVPRVAVFVMPPSLIATTETGRWNIGCVLCHTTRGRPGMAHMGAPNANTEAVEFGIACEACHGPGGEHVRANRSNPVRRYASHFSGDGDDTIVNAKRLTKQRSTEVCAQCHSIRNISKDNAPTLFRIGYNFRPGVALEETGPPILRGGPNYRPAPSPNPQEIHDQLFWPDGMVRVSGREGNGLLDSACFESGEMTCLSCHTMHKSAADPRSYEQWADDQLGPEMRTDRACLQCHESFADKLEAHTHHATGSSGSECMNCHMPYTTWGLMKGIRQHTIDSPTVRATIENGRPNACNACHIDETLEWSAKQLASWYGHEVPDLSDDQKAVAASLLWLLKGDAGQRALAAWYLGWKPAQEVAGNEWIAPLLAPLLEDPYDVVRYVAARSLRGLPGFEDLDYDYVGDEAARTPAKRKVWDQYKEQRATRPGAGETEDTERASRLLLYVDGSLHRVALARLLERRDDRDVTLAE